MGVVGAHALFVVLFPCKALVFVAGANFVWLVEDVPYVGAVAFGAHKLILAL